ncbi:MAG: 50S ribosomal protein L17 [Patescibacteria group bacterium]
MRHHKAQRKFGRVKKVRTALLRSLMRELILHGRIKTTEAKAKEIRPLVEKLVTKARANTVISRRFVAKEFFNQDNIVKKLSSDIAPKYKKQAGGYTRIVKLPRRKSDGSKMAMIEFV